MAPDHPIRSLPLPRQAPFVVPRDEEMLRDRSLREDAGTNGIRSLQTSVQRPK